MTTFTARSKSSTSFSSRAKNSASFTDGVKHTIAFLRSLILTDSSDQVLVGSAEDEVLIWTDDTSGWNNLTKH